MPQSGQLGSPAQSQPQGAEDDAGLDELPGKEGFHGMLHLDVQLQAVASGMGRVAGMAGHRFQLRLVVAGEMFAGLSGGALACLAHPHGGTVEDEEEEGHPDQRGTVADAGAVPAAGNVAEDEEAEHDPDGEEELRLGAGAGAVPGGGQEKHDGQQDGKESVDVPHAAARSQVEHGAEEHDPAGCQGFAGVHLEAEDPVDEAKVQRRTEHRPQGRGILPDEAHVGAQEKPGSEAGVVLAKNACHLGKGTAAPLVALGYEVVAGGKDRHGEGACQYGKDRAKRVRAGQEFPARHGEATLS